MNTYNTDKIIDKLNPEEYASAPMEVTGGWEDTIKRIIDQADMSNKESERVETLLISTISALIASERQAWIRGERCEVCGGKKDSDGFDGLVSMCAKCLEEA